MPSSIRCIVRAASVAMTAMMSIAAVAGAQTTRPPIAQRPTEMRALPVRSMMDVAAINAFRHGTVAGPHPVSPSHYLQSIGISWKPYPRAAGYQVVRSWSATGPWVPATSSAFRSTVLSHDIDGILPGKILYFRVVAPGERDGRPDVIDSSNAAMVNMNQVVSYGASMTTKPDWYVHLVQCAVTQQLAVKLAWHAVPNASEYRVIQATAPTGMPAGTRDYSKTPVSPAGAEANQIATFVVRDTVFSQNAVPTGKYAYAAEPLFRMLNDSQEVWATAFGEAIGIEVPYSPTANFCPAQ